MLTMLHSKLLGRCSQALQHNMAHTLLQDAAVTMAAQQHQHQQPPLQQQEQRPCSCREP